MYKKILVPIDGSECSLRGLEEAIGIAKQSGGALRLVHVVNDYYIDPGYGAPIYTPDLVEALRADGKELLNSAVLRTREQGVPCDSDLLYRVGLHVADLILEEAKSWHADLIVMGTHGRRGLLRLALGSAAELVLRSSPVPVLLIRAQEK